MTLCKHTKTTVLHQKFSLPNFAEKKCEGNKEKGNKLFGCIAEYDYLCIMFEKPTYEELEQVIVTLKSRVAYLERMLYGGKV